MTLLLGIDAGTTSIKAGLFSPDGRCLAVGRQEYQLETPETDWAELDPEVYWSACVAAVHQALDLSGIEPRQVRALAVSSQGETTIPVDRDGRPLHPAIVWLDNRATRQAGRLAEHFGTQVYDVTGLPEISPTWSACKILWLKDNRPQVFQKTHKFLLVQDWLVYRLSGRCATDGSISCTTMLYDILHDCWWKDMLEFVGVREDQLADVLSPGAAAGTLTSQAADELGLEAGVLVVLGGMDQAVGAIGAGNIAPGIVSETTGAALALQISIDRPDIDPTRRVPINKHSIPGVFLSVPFCPTAGMSFKWFRDAFCQEEMAAALSKGGDAYDRLTELAEQAPPGADGLLMLPHLSGSNSPVYNSEARGVFCGFSLGHQKGHFVRAILEAVAFMLRRNLDLARQAGIDPSEIRSSGGGARSQLWCQIKADVCAVPVISLASEEAALLGDVILAGVACGEFINLEDGCRRMVNLRGHTLPGANSPAYQEIYQRYCDLDDTLDAFFRRPGA